MPTIRAALVTGLFFTALTLWLTYPLIVHLGSLVPSDPGDPFLNTWLIWWNAQAAPLTSAWWNAPAFFPSPDTLALSEHFLGFAPLTSPIIWATANPQLAYNIAFLCTFVGCGLGAYLLGFVLTSRHDAALIAGLAFMLAPYRMAQFPHVQVLAAYGMPIALAALHLYLRDRRARWLLVFALATLLQGVTMGYYLLFFPVLVGLWVLWFPVAQRQAGAVGLIGIAFAAACLPLLPILAHYRDVHERWHLSRGINEIVGYSADITALLRTHPDIGLLGPRLPAASPEGQLFPGLTVIVLIAAALLLRRQEPLPGPVDRPGHRWRAVLPVLIGIATVLSVIAAALPLFGPWQLDLPGVTISVTRISRPLSLALAFWCLALIASARVRAVLRSQSVLGFYIAATVAMWVFAFGPHPTFNGERVVYWGPYRWLMLLPGFDGVRVPARFGMLASLTLAAAAGIAFARLVTRMSARGRALTLAAAVVGLFADGWLPAMPLVLPAARSIVTAAATPGAVLELPMGEADTAAMYRGMTHGHPVVNGYSGYNPPFHDVVRAGVESFDPDTLTGLAGLGVRHVVVFHAASDPDDSWNTYVAQMPGTTRQAATDQQSHYLLPALALAPAPVNRGRRLPIETITSGRYPEDLPRLLDNDLGTAWETAQPQHGGTDDYVTIRFDAPTRVGGVRLAMGPFGVSYPRLLVVERSNDCATWSALWQGPTAHLVLESALTDPTTLPIDIAFDAVETSCLRLRQAGRTPRVPWVIAELAVMGPAPSAGPR